MRPFQLLLTQTLIIISATVLISSISADQNGSDLKISKAARSAASELDENNYIAAKSRQVQFSCQLSNGRQPASNQKITWERKVKNQYKKGFTQGNDKIIFEKIQPYHTGTYFCVLEDLSGKKEETRKALTIRVVPMEDYRQLKQEKKRKQKSAAGSRSGSGKTTGLVSSYKPCSSSEQLKVKCVHGVCAKLSFYYTVEQMVCICEPGFMGPSCGFEETIIDSYNMLLSQGIQSSRSHKNLYVLLALTLVCSIVIITTTTLSYVKVKHQLHSSLANNAKLSKEIKKLSVPRRPSEVVKIIRPPFEKSSRDTLNDIPRSSMSLPQRSSNNSPRNSLRTSTNASMSMSLRYNSDITSRLLKPPTFKESDPIQVRSAVDLSQK